MATEGAGTGRFSVGVRESTSATMPPASSAVMPASATKPNTMLRGTGSDERRGGKLSEAGTKPVGCEARSSGMVLGAAGSFGSSVRLAALTSTGLVEGSAAGGGTDESVPVPGSVSRWGRR